MQIVAGLGRWRRWVFLGLIILFVVFVRVRLSEFPLERDEGEYAYMGQLMLQGIPPYLSAYNMKFPGTYAMYAIIMSIFGQTIQGIHFGLMIVNCVTILLVFLLARKYVSENAALAAGAAYALLSLSSTVLGFAAHATHFVVLPTLGGVLLLLVALRDNKVHAYVLSGVLFGLALLMKQPGFFFFLFGATYIIYHHFFSAKDLMSEAPQVSLPLDPPLSSLNSRGEQRVVASDHANSLKRLIFNLFTFAAGGVAPLFITVVFLYAAGAFDKFWFWTIEYASEYATQIPESGVLGAFYESVSEVTEGFLFLWIMAISGLIVMFSYKGMRGRRFFIALFAFFSFLTICPGFHFRRHYFITLLPAIALLIGVFVDWADFRAAALLKTKQMKFIGIGIFLLSAGVGIAAQRSYLFEENPMKLPAIIYGENPFPESLAISRFIKSQSAETDRVAVFGSEPQIFFYSKRHSATGYIYVYGLMESHPYAMQMQKEMIREVESSNPKFIVVVVIATSWLMRSGSEKYILGWLNRYIRDNYTLVGLADIISPDLTIYRWHRDSREYAIRSRHHVLVYQNSRE
ncbi:MAG TPA: glycosyltransferase family 39 protein [Thermodesulfovibrionales bacterium]|nr:glycosyltransferase family 39 protein [Thermodesulfovibrionales bacterium]